MVCPYSYSYETTLVDAEAGDVVYLAEPPSGYKSTMPTSVLAGMYSTPNKAASCKGSGVGAPAAPITANDCRLPANDAARSSASLESTETGRRSHGGARSRSHSVSPGAADV